MQPQQFPPGQNLPSPVASIAPAVSTTARFDAGTPAAWNGSPVWAMIPAHLAWRICPGLERAVSATPRAPVANTAGDIRAEDTGALMG